MKFHLVYKGPLLTKNSPRTSHQHEIRKQIHTQLANLWTLTPGLTDQRRDKLASEFSRCGFRFVPMVCSDRKLVCDLDILFLRRDEPGGLVKSGGDIDNRIKTLFDSLRMPKQQNEIGANVSPGPGEDPFYVLLEDDSLITSFRVDADRLLEPVRSQDDDTDNVLLTITVTITKGELSIMHVVMGL